jgi:hypothetical protein
MDKKIGRFSQNLISLKLQIDTLFDDVGGSQVTELLDALSTLAESERAVALRLMTKVCARLAATENRGFTRSEEKMKELEDYLVDEIVRELHAHPSKLSLVHGGKEIETKKRQTKASSKTEKVEKKILEFKPVLN